MFKPLIQSLFVIASVTSVTACGNKGDLFLPADGQLVEPLGSVDVEMPDSAIEITDEEVLEKKNTKPRQ